MLLLTTLPRLSQVATLKTLVKNRLPIFARAGQVRVGSNTVGAQAPEALNRSLQGLARPVLFCLSAVFLLSLYGAEPARAQANACGALDANGRVVCSSTSFTSPGAGEPQIDYDADGDSPLELVLDETLRVSVDGLSLANGESYVGVSAGGTGAGDVTLISSADVSVTGTTAGSGSSSGILASSTGSGDVTLTLNAGTITHDIRGRAVRGIQSATGTGAVTISSAADIMGNPTVRRSRGIEGLILNTDSTALLDVRVTGGTINTNSQAVFVWHYGLGETRIDISEGDSDNPTQITTTDRTAIFGEIRNSASTSDIDINFSGGAITTTGTGARGIDGRHQGTVQGDERGRLMIRSSGDITTNGDRADGVLGYVTPGAEANLEIDLSGGVIRTMGTRSYGVNALGDGDSGDVMVTSTADIRSSSFGILARQRDEDTTGDVMVMVMGGSIETREDGAHGVGVVHSGMGGTQLMVAEGARVSVQGMDAHGVAVNAANDDAMMNTVTVNGTVVGGQGDGRAVYLTNGGMVRVGDGGMVQAGESGMAVEAGSGELVVELTGTGMIDGMVQGGMADTDSFTLRVNGMTLVQNNVMTGMGGQAVAVDNALYNRRLEQAGAAGSRMWEFSERIVTSRALVFEALPQGLLQLARMTVSESAGAEPDAAHGGRQARGAWLRFSGGAGSFGPRRSGFLNEYRQKYTQLRFGVDRTWPGANANEGLALGISGHYQDGTSNRMQGASVGVAEIESEGYGGGVYGSWWKADGVYVQGDMAATRYSGVARGMQLVSDFNGTGVAFRVETGRVLPHAGWKLRPHVEMSVTWLGMEDLTAPFVARYDDSISARPELGLGVERAFTHEDGTGRVYAEGGVSYEFLAETEVLVAGERLRAEPDALWGELSLGSAFTGSFAPLWGADYEFYVELNGAMSSDSHTWDASLGMRVHF